MPIVIDVPEGGLNNVKVAIERAFEVARNTGGEIQILIAAGVHRVDAPIVISGRSAEAAKITISGSGLGRTVITGARLAKAEGLEGVSADLRSSIPKACAARVRLVRLSDRELQLFDGFLPRHPRGLEKPSLPTVSQRGIQLHPARWPAEGYYHGVAERSGGGAVGYLTVGAGVNLKEGELLWGGGFWSRDYFYELNRVRFSESLKRISIADAEVRRSGDTKFAIFNALSSLVRPGTYVYRPEMKAILVCPFRDGEISVASTPELLRVEDFQGLKVERLEFTGATSVGMLFRNASHVVVDHVSVRGVSGAGIVIAGGKDITIRRSLVEEIGSTGISVSGGDRKLLVASGHKVIDNTIRDFGQIDHSYRPGINLLGVGNVVRGNAIYQAPHSAIIFSGNDHRISNNRIYDVNLDEGDAGAIYTGRDWTARGTIISDNVLSRIGNGRDPVRGVYLDDLASGIVVSGNRFLGVRNPILVGGGRDNQVLGNRFTEAKGVAIAVDERGRTWYRGSATDPNGELRTRLTKVPFDGAAYRERYRNISNLLSDSPEAPKYNRIMGNCAFGPAKLELFKAYQDDNEAQPIVPCNTRKGRAVMPETKPIDISLLSVVSSLNRTARKGWPATF